MAGPENWSAATRITAIYLALGVTWIVISDVAVALMVGITAAGIATQLLKGLLFVLVTAVILHLLIAHQVRRIREAEAASRALYEQTMRVVTHLMNDHLNTMLFFKFKADESGAITPELSKQWEEMLFATSDRIRRLGELEVVDPQVLDRFLAMQIEGGGDPAAEDRGSGRA